MTLNDVTPSRERAAARSIALRNVAGAVVGGLLIAAIEFAATRGSVEYSVQEQVVWGSRLAMHWVLAALPLGLIMGALELRAPGRAPPWPVYIVVVGAGAVTGALVMALHGKYVDPAIAETSVGLDLALPDRFLYGLWQLAFWGTVGAVLHATDLRHKRSAEALRDGEIARLRSESSLAAVRLAALHAQVEPEFVLATLGRVERLGERDLAAADRVLDALIRFLREATPLLRRPVSTLTQECRLLDGYVGVLGAAAGVTDALQVEMDARAEHAVLPPGILISLAQCLLGSAAVHVDRVDVAVRARWCDGAVDVGMSVTANSIVEPRGWRDFVERTEQRLKATCGPSASLTVRQEAQCRSTLAITLIDRRGTGHEQFQAH